MPRILIVDDNEIDREAVSRCLRPLDDLELLFAEDGQAALESVNSEPPEAVITDLRMPGMDGLALVEALQEDFPQLPVVLMTSRGSERIAVQALRAGAASYVPKRNLQQSLLETVVKLLEVAKAARKRKQVAAFVTGMETRVLLPNDLTMVTPLVAFFQDNLRRIGFGDESIRVQVGIALMEALTNAIVHGNLELDSDLKRMDPGSFERLLSERPNLPPYSRRRVHCRAVESSRQIEYTIRDEGPGFDINRLPEKQASSLLDIAGRGVMLMRSFMDEVRYSRKGNELKLIKQIRRGESQKA